MENKAKTSTLTFHIAAAALSHCISTLLSCIQSSQEGDLFNTSCTDNNLYHRLYHTKMRNFIFQGTFCQFLGRKQSQCSGVNKKQDHMTKAPEKFLTTKIQHTLKRLLTLRTCRLLHFKHTLWCYKTFTSLQGPVYTNSSLKRKASFVLFSGCVQFLLLLFFLKLKY